MFDAEGRLVYRFEIRNQKTEIDFNAACGMYVLKVGSQGFSLIRKLARL